jgi:hypothetical protein
MRWVLDLMGQCRRLTCSLFLQQGKEQGRGRRWWHASHVVRRRLGEYRAGCGRRRSARRRSQLPWALVFV